MIILFIKKHTSILLYFSYLLAVGPVVASVPELYEEIRIDMSDWYEVRKFI